MLFQTNKNAFVLIETENHWSSFVIKYQPSVLSLSKSVCSHDRVGLSELRLEKK